MIPADPKQKQRIAILTKGDKEYKAALVFSQTQDDTKTSTNDLTHAQANHILVELGAKPMLYDNWALFNKNVKSHKYILSLAIQYGWSNQHPTFGQVADLFKISEWLKSKRAPVNKPLLKMTSNGKNSEVSKTISALESMIQKKY